MRHQHHHHQHHQQRGGTIVGFILGLLVGLAIAFGVAVYVSKIPIPFVNRDAQPQAQPLPNWNPNAVLGGKVTPVPLAPALPAAQQQVPSASADPLGELVQAQLDKTQDKTQEKTQEKTQDKAQDKAIAADGYQYFVQVGAFRSRADADARRAKLSLLGQQAQVSEREQNGRPVFRVRIGPLAERAEGQALKKQLDNAGMETVLVRIQH